MERCTAQESRDRFGGPGSGWDPMDSDGRRETATAVAVRSPSSPETGGGPLCCRDQWPELAGGGELARDGRRPPCYAAQATVLQRPSAWPSTRRRARYGALRCAADTDGTVFAARRGDPCYTETGGGRADGRLHQPGSGPAADGWMDGGREGGRRERGTATVAAVCNPSSPRADGGQYDGRRTARDNPHHDDGPHHDDIRGSAQRRPLRPRDGRRAVRWKADGTASAAERGHLCKTEAVVSLCRSGRWSRCAAHLYITEIVRAEMASLRCSPLLQSCVA
jgi:hypothetical protein